MKNSWKKIVSVLLAAVLMVLSVSDLTGSRTVNAAENNSVTIHYKSEWGGANIFYWNQNGGYNNPVKWPGTAMSAEGDGWYVYTFENTRNVTFMFQYDGKQTKHYTKEAGEYWCVNNAWYTHKPGAQEITPTPTEKPTATPKPTAIPTVDAEVTLLPTRAVTPTSAPQVTIPASDKAITLHFHTEQQSAKVFYWNVNYGTNSPVTWPGVDMVSEGNNWYGYTIPNAKAANVVFTTENGETEEISLVDGEWWYANGEIMDYNPYGDVTVTVAPTATVKPTDTLDPTATAAPTATVAPDVTQGPTVTEGLTPTPELTATAAPTATVEPTAATEPTATPKPEVKGKIIVHYYSSGSTVPTIYYWGRNGDTEDTPLTWPGVAMEKDTADGWYIYTLEDTTSANIIFVGSTGQTDDLSQKEGEWWYKDSKWYDYDPSGPTPTPGPTNTPRPTSTPRPTRDPSLPTPTPVPRDADWDFRDETIYFLMTTRFYDGDSTNNYYSSGDAEAGNPESDPSWRGDFKGLIEKLDYIKALGFTAIWITPVVENNSAYDYHGYHAYDFSKVDSRYESDGATYQDLIDACHEKGMKIIQDVVWNHTCNWGERNLLMIDNPVYGGGRSEYVMPAGALLDTENIYHHNGFTGGGDFDNYNVQISTMADDCFDLETENPKVNDYLIDCYTKFVEMGVDGFRVDTVKHMSRVMLNSTLVPAMQEAAANMGNDKFYMFGEVCTKGHDVWYREAPPISSCFYTWADDETWTSRWSDTSLESNEALVEEHYKAHSDMNNQPTSDNAFLNGNDYHTPDYSQRSGLDVIDFQMHWSFINATNAFNMAKTEDSYFNDSTWNVVYVDSHDYAPDECQEQRYTGSTDDWAENLSLMFTFRGIPCLYYGSEVEFMKGAQIDEGTTAKLSTTGRAYYGDYLEGDVTATDFSEYTASGTVADTLSSTLAQHLQRLNKIRAAIPALRKGQYSTEGVSGNLAYKRRYTNTEVGIDSFVCVAVSEGATFTGIPNGTYTDAVTGDVQQVTDGTLSISLSGRGNMRAYVLDTELTKAPGKVGEDGPYLK